jgi:hypothetical protein
MTSMASPHPHMNSPATPRRHTHKSALPGQITREAGTDAIYHGWPRPDELISVVIESPPATYRPLPHLIRHSPNGFNCGYNGNGPRDLALSLLTDTLHAFIQQHEPAGPSDGPHAQRHSSTPFDIPVVNPVDSTCLCYIQPTLLSYLQFTEQIVAAWCRVLISSSDG